MWEVLESEEDSMSPEEEVFPDCNSEEIMCEALESEDEDCFQHQGRLQSIPQHTHEDQSILHSGERNKTTSPLPFPLLRKDWYKEQGRLAEANRARSTQRVVSKLYNHDGTIAAVRGN